MLLLLRYIASSTDNNDVQSTHQCEKM